MTNTLNEAPSLPDPRAGMVVELKGGYPLTEMDDGSLIVEGQAPDGTRFAWRMEFSKPWTL